MTSRDEKTVKQKDVDQNINNTQLMLKTRHMFKFFSP